MSFAQIAIKQIHMKGFFTGEQSIEQKKKLYKILWVIFYLTSRDREK